MKHNLRIISILILLFLLSQYIGLFITSKTAYKELPYEIERPDLDEKTSYIQMFLIILILTAVILIISYFKLLKLWILWFFLSVWFILLISFSAFMNNNLALVLAFILAILKIRKNIFFHNLTEVFIYGGIAAVFVPLFNMFTISMLLILISIYDIIAVWKTKHMIKLAKFQVESKIFAGLLIPYGKKAAILGGGDMAFPLLFSGVALRYFGYLSFLIPLITALALFLLLYKGKKNKFYPAMPFLSFGCFISLLLIYLSSLF